MSVPTHRLPATGYSVAQGHPIGLDGQPLVLHVIGQGVWEPDRKWRQSRRPSPLLYYRRPVAGWPGMDRRDFEEAQRAAIEHGGLETWALWDLLIAYAADRAWGRWFFVSGYNGYYRPLSVPAIAHAIRQDPVIVALAVDVLVSRGVGLLEWIPMPGDEAMRPSELAEEADGPQGQPAPDRPPEAQRGPAPPPAAGSTDPGSESGHDGGTGGLRGADGPVGSPSRRGEPENRTQSGQRASCQASGGPGNSERPCARGGVLASPVNKNKNKNENRRSAPEPSLRSGTAVPPGAGPTGTETAGRPARPASTQPGAAGGGNGDATAPGRAPGVGHASAPGTGAGPRPAVGVPTGGQPRDDGTRPAGSPAPAASPSAGGGGAPRGGPRAGEAQDGQAWMAELLPAALADETGDRFARLVCRALRFPAGLSIRETHRQIGVFAAQWRRCVDLVRLRARAYGEEAALDADGWPDWFRKWAYGRLRHAASIDVARYPDLQARARVWTSRAYSSLVKLMDARDGQSECL